MSSHEMLPSPRGIGRERLPLGWAVLAIALTSLTPKRTRAAETAEDSPEAAVRSAYAELGGLLWAPRTQARDDEIGKLLARDVDFEELTRRAFGEPCPRAGCVDHWAELSPAQRAEVEPIFADVVTRQWTRELAKGSGYDIDVLPAVTHTRDVRVRVLVRPKAESDKAPIVVDTFFFASHTPYRLVDVDVDGSRLARTFYKQFDRTLTSPGEGYVYLVSRLRKKLDKGGAAKEPEAAPERADEEEADAAAPVSDAPIVEPKVDRATHGLPWLPIVGGGTAVAACAAWIARRRRNAAKTTHGTNRKGA